jgi:hypothetical protein
MGSSGTTTTARLVPVLHVPAPAPGHGGQPGLGVHGHREADALEQRQVRRRVGIGHRLAEIEPAVGRVLGQHQRPRLPGGGPLSSRPVKRPSSSTPSEAHTTSSNSGRSGSTTKSRAPVMRTVR